MKQYEQILRDQKTELFSADYSILVSRKEEQTIDLNSRLAQIVIGVRRCGKSTLCQKVLMQSKVHFAYINFDDEILASLQSNQLNDILEMLYRIYGPFTHLFMDEIQNIPNWHLFVNRLLRQGLHLVLTGSNANLLSGELATHLTGRYNEIHLFPFSFSEYCHAKNLLTNDYMTTKSIGLILHALDAYLLSGGFPETLSMSRQDKYITSLYSAIISKDICSRYKVRYKKTLQQLANAMLDHACQEVSYSKLQSDYNLSSIHTTKNYVSYLENACLIRLIPKYSFKSIERQIHRKSYSIDNAFISNHGDVLQTDNLGWRLENTIAIELLRRIELETQQLFYIRQNRDYEVDFVIVDRNRVMELIQVTYDFTNPKTKTYNREIGGLLKGSADTHCTNLTLIMMSGEARDITIDGKTIHCVLAKDWLLGRV